VVKTELKVRVPPLSSMIRVDVVNRMDIGYDEASAALGEDPGCVDRTIMFANPEDAAG
jgi:hypothetical protein